MEQHKTKWQTGDHTESTERLLDRYYSQLLKWGLVLTQGDVGKAEETVQEFCLYFVLTKPDLSNVMNLDGYLYTCLRHIYVSDLARSSREAMRFVSVADFDSFEFALAGNPTYNLLQRQNELRRICGYVVWRKEFSKSASYFILHFFHGYSRAESAQLAQLPIQAIYNKLKVARSEIKSHLDDAGKLRVVNRNLPPAPPLAWSVVSTPELFKELRGAILKARLSDCLPEDELLSQYRSPMPRPIECSLLAHFVSCHRCLEIVDRHFRRPTLRDREPLDGFDSVAETGTGTSISVAKRRKLILQSVRKRWDMVHEHRPSTLSIAVDGRIIAFHDIQAERSTLSARIEQPEKAHFIEVFSELDVRFALLAVVDPPPEGSHVRAQRVELSDSRWLELSLTFDGLGLNSQVAYYDPALATELLAETEEYAEAWPAKFSYSIPEVEGRLSRIVNKLAHFSRPVIPSSTMSWAIVLVVIFGTTGYLAYRHTIVPQNAMAILNRSIRIESAALVGQTEYQVLRFEEATLDGRVLQQGTVDLWKDGDGSRYLRRFYDSDHRLLAARWRNKDGEHSSDAGPRNRETPGSHRSLPMNHLWEQEFSARAFGTLSGKGPQIHTVKDGYKLTTIGPVEGRPRFISATLILDREFLPIEEAMRVQVGTEIHEVRWIRTVYERKPAASVPDAIFDPEEELRSLHAPRSSRAQPGASQSVIGANVQLARLQIAVLSRLNSLGSDTGEPIEVFRTPEGHIRVSGTVGNRSLEQQISSDLEKLQDHQLLDLRISSARDIANSTARTKPQDTNVYEVGGIKPPADEALRRYFQAKGFSGEQLDSAVDGYCLEVLKEAQRALQHAYALRRLGGVLSTVELSAIGTASQQQWSEMVLKHANDLENQLQWLRARLAEAAQPNEDDFNERIAPIIIENPDQFNREAVQLLRQTQDLNREVGRFFTSNGSEAKQSPHESSLQTITNTVPLWQAREIEHFAMKLNSAQQSEFNHQIYSGNDKGTLEHPR